MPVCLHLRIPHGTFGLLSVVADIYHYFYSEDATYYCHLKEHHPIEQQY